MSTNWVVSYPRREEDPRATDSLVTNGTRVEAIRPPIRHVPGYTLVEMRARGDDPTERNQALAFFGSLLAWPASELFWKAIGRASDIEFLVQLSDRLGYDVTPAIRDGLWIPVCVAFLVWFRSEAGRVRKGVTKKARVRVVRLASLAIVSLIAIFGFIVGRSVPHHTF